MSGFLTDPEREQLVRETTPEVKKAVRAERPRAWRQPWFWLAVVGLLLAVAAYLSLLAKSSHNAGQAAAARSDAATANSVAQALSSQVRQLGGVPVASPPTQGERGERGPGPTDAQIAGAVAQYCALHGGCAGTPSQAQVSAAVHAFCAAGACRGPAGAKGGVGASGQPGAAGASGASGAKGAPGPAPTDDQVAAAVAAYCTAHGDCTGPAGPKGDTGAAGRGIASIDCTGLGVDQLVVHYDDGTDQTVECGPGSTDTPTPSGAPTS